MNNIPWVYLAAPYSHPDPKVIEARMKIYSLVDAHLILKGYYTMSPLSKHWLLQFSDLPGDWQFWQGYGTKMLTKCDIMCVICMDGWKDSIGVQAELEIAREQGIQIMYVNEQGEEITPKDSE